MGEMSFYWEKDWLDILKEQEEKLVYETFTREQALELGLIIEKLCREKYKRNAAIRIMEDTAVIFAYKMEGTSLENDWWMDRKIAFARLTGGTSLGGYVRMKAGEIENIWQDRIDNMATCGGCVPVRMKDGGPVWAYVLVSGMDHEIDHQVIADAMAIQLGIEIPSVAKEKEC